jgi:myosin-9
MLETVRIRRAGYSVRIEYEQFAHLYRILLRNGMKSTKEEIVDFIHRHQSIDRSNVQFGLTKIFMRDAEKLIIDDQLHRVIIAHILRLQGWFRTQIARRRFLKIRAGVVKIQAGVRGMLVRERLRHQTMAALCIQTYWRAYGPRTTYVRTRNTIIQLQALARGFLFRARFNTERDGYAAKLGIIRGSSAKLFQIQHFFHAFELPSFNIKSMEDVLADGSENYLSGEDMMRPLTLKDNNESALDLEGSDTLDAEFNFILTEDSKLKLMVADKKLDESARRRQSVQVTSSSMPMVGQVIRRAASDENVSGRMPMVWFNLLLTAFSIFRWSSAQFTSFTEYGRTDLCDY